MTDGAEFGSNDDRLDWPPETAGGFASAGRLQVEGSNIVLDVHGDPVRARLALLSDGNHHMALAEAAQAFLAAHPGVEDVLYVTAPPRILLDTLATGRLSLGNLVLTIAADAFISPRAILERLAAEGRIGPPRSFAESRGTAILVRKGNPRAIGSVADLLRDDVRLALSNPSTEAASFGVYAAAIEAAAVARGLPQAGIAERLRSDRVVKSRVIHHREIPELVASGRADASLVYAHLALRCVRIFPSEFEMLAGTPLPVTEYAVGIVGAGGEFGQAFAAFMQSRTAADIYRHHGLQPAERR
jgi:ABC-type molybdate transport system substrate-binding protein